MSQVGNKNIDNASGQVVRLDMQNTLQAVATNNFGPRNDAGTILPCEFLADDTTNKLLIRKSSGGDQANPNPTSGTAADFFEVGELDTANLGLLPKAGGTMTGPLLADDASGASAPAISFDGDADTGIFRVGSNTIGFATAGVERVEISDSGLDMSNGLPIRFQDSSGAPFVALKSPSSVSANRTFTLPGTTGTAGQFLSVSSSNHSATNAELVFTTVQGVPSGSVFCMAVATVPTGYLECNGAAVSRTTYSALFAIIGTAYGTGNGSSTFNLPDLRGEFIRGFDNGKGTDSGRAIASAQTGDNQQHSHNYTNNSITVSGANHNHDARKFSLQPSIASVGITLGSGQGYQIGYSINDTGATDQAILDSGSLSMTGTVGITISNQGSETRPRNIAMMYVIKT